MSLQLSSFIRIFQLICSYVLYPVSFFMGTDTTDCRKVAELIGVKTFTNEFIAYGQLKDLIANRKVLNNYTSFFNTTQWHWEKDNIVLDLTKQVLTGGVLSVIFRFLTHSGKWLHMQKWLVSQKCFVSIVKRGLMFTI